MNCPECNAKMINGVCTNCGYSSIAADEVSSASEQFEDVFSDSPVSMVKVESVEEGYNTVDEDNKVVNGEQPDNTTSDFVDPSEVLKRSVIKKKSGLKNKRLPLIIAAAAVAVALIVGAILLITGLSKSSVNYSLANENVTYINNTAFFANPADSYKLYKLDKANGQPVKLLDESVKYLTTDGSKIYFSLCYNDDILCSILPDGSGYQSALTEKPARYNACFGKYLYFSNPYEDNQIYRMNANGELEQIPGATGTDVMATSHFVYFIDNGTLAGVSLKNGERIDFMSNVSDLFTDGKNLVFTSNGTVSYFENAKGALAQNGYQTNITDASNAICAKDARDFYYLNSEGAVIRKNIEKDTAEQMTAEGGYDQYCYMESAKAIIAIDYDEMKVVYVKSAGNEITLPLEKINPYRNSYAEAGNAINEGYGATDGEYLYFLNYNSSCMEKVKVGDDIASSEVLAAVPTAFMACSDGYVYYSDYSMNGLLYRIKPDGTQSARISPDVASNVVAYGDWIYYTTSNSDLGEYYIRRASKNGLVTNTLVTANLSKMDIYDGWIYYSTIDTENQTADIYRMATNGEYNQPVVEGLALGSDSTQIFALYDGKLYYKDNAQGLISCDLNGENKKLVSGANMQCFCIQDDYLYYSDSNANNALKKMPLDVSSEAETLTEQIAFGMSICGDKIVFASYDSKTMNFAIYCIGTDGSGLTEIG